MNKRRVHELMQAEFPSAAPAHQVWLNIADGQGRLLEEVAQAIVAQPFLSLGITEVLVQVRRKICGRIPVSQLMSYVALHLAEGHIRIADRAFSVFAVVDVNGAATSWQRADTGTPKSDLKRHAVRPPETPSVRRLNGTQGG